MAYERSNTLAQFRRKIREQLIKGIEKPVNKMTDKQRLKAATDGLDLMPGLDLELGIYEITDLFHSYYKYHNENCIITYDDPVISQIQKGDDITVKVRQKSISRFDALRRIEISKHGARPFLANEGIAAHKPNSNLGYLSLLFAYLTLPYKAVVTGDEVAKVQINRRLYDSEKLTPKEKDELKVSAANDPNLVSNAEISDDVSDAFNVVLLNSNKVKECLDRMPIRVVQDGLVAFVHSDVDWQPEQVDALDFIFEPQATYDVSKWSAFFVIKKMTAHEAVTHIRKNSKFWNPTALRWALENANNNRGFLGTKHYNNLPYHSSIKTTGENFTVRSFIAEKGLRSANIGSYYGNMLVAEAYYVNTQGKIDKCIFFPSKDFINVDPNTRRLREDYKKTGLAGKLDQDALEAVKFGDVLFHRTNVAETMADVLTVIPFDRSEHSLERQRGFGHELFSSIEIIMRLDSAVLNLATMMGSIFTKSNQGNSASDIEELEIELDGNTTDMGDREFVTLPYKADLNSMLGVRRVMYDHVLSKSFLGGLDGLETMQSGRGASMASMRLVRDARVHKHNIEYFGTGLNNFYTNCYRGILEMRDKDLHKDEVLIQKLFYDTITEVHGHPIDLFDYKSEDVVPDTRLPYWMLVSAIRNGSSNFGAAELILLTEVKNTFGDGLDQRAASNLARIGLKSLLGSSTALDILGDPKENVITAIDQIYRATLENSSILGSVSSSALNFETVIILPDKDDHVAHLQKVHNPKAQEIIKKLQENDVTPQILQDMSETDIDSRNSLILELGALANHISLHQQQLDRFGKKREDINRLKEETNAILQAAEGLMNSLQINLRVLQQKKQETALKLQNMSPENEATKADAQVKMLKIQSDNNKTSNQLLLANKIADQRQQQHIDKQLTKARDRALKDKIAARDADLRQQEMILKANEKTQAEQPSE
jgi:hypothetical protein